MSLSTSCVNIICKVEKHEGSSTVDYRNFYEGIFLKPDFQRNDELEINEDDNSNFVASV